MMKQMVLVLSLFLVGWDYSQSPFVVGGEHVKKGDPIWNSTVLVALFNGDCSGVLIADDIVLTAGHCLRGYPAMHVGFYKGKKKFEKRGILRSRVHPNYSADEKTGTVSHDIALIRIKGAAPAGYGSVIIGQSSQLRRGDMVMAAGYGQTATRQLKKVGLTILDPGYSAHEFLLDQREGNSVCYGDSGGPTYAIQGNTIQLMGLASRLKERGCGSDVIYTSVSYFRRWIEKTVEELKRAG